MEFGELAWCSYGLYEADKAYSGIVGHMHESSLLGSTVMPVCVCE
jgi:hypothetical protein